MGTILLIENNRCLLENLTEGLELEGYKIIATNDGMRGVELAKEFKPKLIISAILLGETDGYEVLRLLLAAPNTSTIPFIFSTTKSEKKDKEKGLSLGAADYIVKPYELESLVQMARSHINSCRGEPKEVRISNYSPLRLNFRFFLNQTYRTRYGRQISNYHQNTRKSPRFPAR